MSLDTLPEIGEASKKSPKEGQSINYEYLIKVTGDPFVDIGGYIIKYLGEIESDKNIIELIEQVAKIYVNNWGAKLNAFFLNSTITQPAFNSNRKIQETIIYYKNLIADKEDFKEGYCRITGRKAKLFSAGRDNHILSGSGTFINFHHSLESGIYLSKEALIRVFFVPLGLIQLGDKVALVYSNLNEITEYFATQNCINNLQRIGNQISEGILKSEFSSRNPSNALFDFAEKIIITHKIPLAKIDEGKHQATLNLYHFTNFGANPEINLYNLPANVFNFYSYCNTHHRSDWRKFINFYYSSSKYKEAKFNYETSTLEVIRKKEKEIIEYETYKTWANRVYSKLLRGESILQEILRYVKKHTFDFRIVEIYQRNIGNMEHQTVNKIKDLANFIADNPDEGKIKKSLSNLNQAKSSSDLRRFLIGLIKRNYEDGSTKPLITLEDYVDYLFPDSIVWREVRDVLLIAIYQRLHEKNLIIPTEDDEDDSNDDNTEKLSEEN